MMKQAGGVAGRVLGRLSRGRSYRINRSAAGRLARRVLKIQRRNWRINGTRPRGRGYDWARQLIPEELLKCTNDSGEVTLTVSSLAARVRCSRRTVQIYLRALSRCDGSGKPAQGTSACIRLLARRAGRGFGLCLAINAGELQRLIKYNLARGARRGSRPSPQRELFKMQEPKLDSETQAILDRIQAKARERSRSGTDGVEKANRPAPGDRSFFRGIGDLSPHSPLSQKIPLNASLRSVPSDALRAARVKNSAGRWVLARPPTRQELSAERDLLRQVEQQSATGWDENIRRQLMRLIRLWCWARGLDQVRTRRVTGAVGWEAQRIGKGLKRKYFLWDCVAWVARSKPAELKRATDHFLATQGAIGAMISAGSELRRASSR